MIAQTTHTYKPVAHYAELKDRIAGELHITYGIALRTAEGRVFFCAEGTGTWTELFDKDWSRLQLNGREDLARVAAIEDGNLVVKCSRTLQRAA